MAEPTQLENERYFLERKFVMCMFVVVWTLLFSIFKVYTEGFAMGIVLTTVGGFITGEMVERYIKK